MKHRHPRYDVAHFIRNDGTFEVNGTNEICLKTESFYQKNY